MKRILAAVLSLSLLLSFGSPAVAQAGSGSEYFTDIPSDAWYAEYIDICYESGLMNGVGDGRFDPHGTVTNAQMMMVCARLNHLLNGGDGDLSGILSNPLDYVIFFTDERDERVAVFEDVRKSLEGFDLATNEPPVLAFSEEAMSRLRDAVNPVDVITLHVANTVASDEQQEYQYDFIYEDGMYVDPNGNEQEWFGQIFKAYFIVGLGASFTKDSEAWYSPALFYLAVFDIESVESDSNAISEAAGAMDAFNGPAALDDPCLRANLAYYLAIYTPEEYLNAINEIDSVPELDIELIRRLYRAGIMGGVDEYGTLSGHSTLKRSEFAAVIARIVEPELRLTLNLKESDTPVLPVQSDTLVIYNWGEYMDPDVIREFERVNSVKIDYRTYSTPEELYAILKSGKQVDVVITIDYMIDRLRSEGLLEKLSNSVERPNNSDRLSGLETLAFDPTGEYAVPYLWSITGLAYNNTRIKTVDSWDSIFSAQSNKIGMLDNIRESMAMALKSLGYSVNTTKHNELDAAFNLLLEQEKQVVQYYDYIMDYHEFDSTIDIAPLYNVDVHAYHLEAPYVSFSLPKEGSILQIDAAAIMASSQNKATAETFLSYLCDTDVALKNAEYTAFLTPFRAVYEKLPPVLRENPQLYPSTEYLKSCEVLLDLPEDTRVLYDEYDIRLKSES